MYVQIAIIGLAVAGSGWMGYELADGRCAAAMHALEVAHRDAQDRAIAEASAELAAEARRAVQAAEERGRRSVAAREVINEIHVVPDVRDCSWTPDQRLRIDRLYATYGVDTGAADRVSDPVSSPAPD